MVANYILSATTLVAYVSLPLGGLAYGISHVISATSLQGRVLWIAGTPLYELASICLGIAVVVFQKFGFNICVTQEIVQRISRSS